MKFKVISLMLLVLLATKSWAAGDVGVTVKLNKDNFKLGDDFLVEITIQNNSSREIRILPWEMYDYYWLQITDVEGKLVLGRALIRFDLDDNFPYPGSYKVLAPGDVHVVFLKGKMEKTKNVFKDENYPKDSISISFPFVLVLAANSKPSSAVGCPGEENKSQKRCVISTQSDIPLSKPGTYFLQAKYEPWAPWFKTAANYGFKDMWQGSAVSDKVKFSVSK